MAPDRSYLTLRCKTTYNRKMGLPAPLNACAKSRKCPENQAQPLREQAQPRKGPTKLNVISRARGLERGEADGDDQGIGRGDGPHDEPLGRSGDVSSQHEGEAKPPREELNAHVEGVDDIRLGLKPWAM